MEGSDLEIAERDHKIAAVQVFKMNNKRIVIFPFIIKANKQAAQKQNSTKGSGYFIIVRDHPWPRHEVTCRMF